MRSILLSFFVMIVVYYRSWAQSSGIDNYQQRDYKDETETTVNITLVLYHWQQFEFRRLYYCIFSAVQTQIRHIRHRQSEI